MIAHRFEIDAISKLIALPHLSKLQEPYRSTCMY